MKARTGTGKLPGTTMPGPMSTEYSFPMGDNTRAIDVPIPGMPEGQQDECEGAPADGMAYVGQPATEVTIESPALTITVKSTGGDMRSQDLLDWAQKMYENNKPPFEDKPSTGFAA